MKACVRDVSEGLMKDKIRINNSISAGCNCNINQIVILDYIELWMFLFWWEHIRGQSNKEKTKKVM
jgi:hypothetical protein